MNNQEKITVISSQKPLLPKPVIILLVISVIAIILLAIFYLQKNFFTQNKPAPVPAPATDQNLPKLKSPPKDTTNSPPPLPTIKPVKK